MKKKSILIVLGALLLALGTLPAWPQSVLATVEGKIADDGKPLPDVKVVFTSTSTGKVISIKTSKDGSYSSLGFPIGEYKVEVVSATGEVLFRIEKTRVSTESSGKVLLSIDITKDRQAGGQPLMTKEQIEAIKAQNAKATNLNALIGDAKKALDAKNWQDAITPLQQMIEIDPKRWEFYQALGNAQLNLAKYQEAADTLDKGITAAQTALSDPKGDPKGDPKAEAVTIKKGIGQMLTNQGNAYIKMGAAETDAAAKQKKNELAIAAFNKAAGMDPNPATAFFNLCATQYNLGQMQAASLACDKAIAADPTKADAYFIKGSAMYGNGTMDKDNKYVVPPGTVDALNKYLELAPTGPHAADVKAMLEAVGAKIETSFGKKKK